MTKSLATEPARPWYDPELLEYQVQQYHDLARQRGRQPGRPTVIQELGVTDARARKIMSAAQDHTASPTAAQRLHVVPPAPRSERQPVNGHHPATTTGELAAPLAAATPDDQGKPRTTSGASTANDGTPEPSSVNNHPPDTDVATSPAGATHQAAPPGGTTSHHQPTSTGTPNGATGFYIVAVMSLAVSADTSWRFFEHVIGITAVWERIALFAIMEAGLVACGFAMRANVARFGRPGPERLVAWALSAFAAAAAVVLSGPITGMLRVALGPLLGLTMLHLALGIDARIRRQGPSTSTWARIGHELRERTLSRIGLADDQRDALTRTRDRHALDAARVVCASRFTPRRIARLRKHVSRSNAAHDPAQRDRLLAELGALRHADELLTLQQTSPWTSTAQGGRS